MEANDLIARAEPGARKAHKREILRTALACFDENGIDATTIEIIRQRADSSIGSMYHHFGNKDGLIAALYLMALDDQQALIEPAVIAARDAHDAIRAMLSTYLQWVVQEPRMARFMFGARHFVASGPQQDALAERNKRRFGGLQRWLAQGVKQGAIRPLPREVYASLLIGPAESYCRAWLSGRVKTKPTEHAVVFIDAAWRAMAA